MALGIHVEEGRSFTKTLRLVGRLDNETSGELERALDQVLATALKTLVFDLSGLEYTTSAGLRVFMRAQQTMKQRAGKALFVNPQAPVQKVFDIAKAADLGSIFRNVQELDAYLDVMQKRAKEDAE